LRAGRYAAIPRLSLTGACSQLPRLVVDEPPTRMRAASGEEADRQGLGRPARHDGPDHGGPCPRLPHRV
jgi:hypothetical protein